MAVLVVVAANVRTVIASSTQITTGVLGETITAGQVVYQSTADNKYYLSDGNAVDPLNSRFGAYAIAGGGDGETVALQTGGTIYLGVSALTGVLYGVSVTPGGTEDASSNQTSGVNTMVIGYGDANNNVVIDTTETLLTIA